VFAKTAEDTALLAEVLFGHDEKDAATAPSPHPRLLATCKSDPPVKPTFAAVRTPYWDRASEETKAAFEELVAALGEQCFEVDLPTPFAEASQIRETINFAEMAKFYAGYYSRHREALSDRLVAAIEKGNAIPARDYIAALDWPTVLNAGLGEIFERCDAIITPAATGPAPAGLESTGDPVFNGLWTLCGVPALTLPVFEDENGMPMGIQVVGPKNNDGRLLRSARWLAARIAGTE
ncbi:MAG: amidase, partial [Hyphomicrobiales bacterium]|nr:amidase [Hyphomicrobiales bacterium]